MLAISQMVLFTVTHYFCALDVARCRANSNQDVFHSHASRHGVRIAPHAGAGCAYSSATPQRRLHAQCRAKCQEDLMSTTRYVTWSLHTKSRTSLKAMLNRVRAVATFCF